MTESTLLIDSLVLYRGRPARVRKVARKKVEIEVEEGPAVSVRPKDISLLHPGPVESLSELHPVAGEVRTAWELLAGSTTTLAELAELAYGEFTPPTAWAAWQLVADGLYFGGTPDLIMAHGAEVVAEQQKRRELKAAEEQAWSDFLERAAAGRYQKEDCVFLEEVAALALGRRERSQVLRDLGLPESPENAHAFLLKLGYWEATINPYPQRAGLVLATPRSSLSELPDEARRDLTHLVSLAIDDEGSQDPDDALSFEDGRLWVHIADVAALVPPDSPADVEARGRGANLYLPEGTVPMLPEKATRRLALGLAEKSPALSFGLDLDPDGRILALEVVPSWIRVTRLTYESAESQMDVAPLRNLYLKAQAYEALRQRHGALHLDLPEVRVRIREGQVTIYHVPRLRSRDLVREAMLMTGEAVANYALEHGIPMPYTTQSAPLTEQRESSMPSAMYALRRSLKPSQQTITPAPHAGLGLKLYVQCTSPLRRYLDLVVHQQLRAHFCSNMLLDAQAVMERVGATVAIVGSVRWAERRSIEHWTLVYLLQNPGWTGQGIVVDRKGRHDIVLIPDLDLECRVYSRRPTPLDSLVNLTLRAVELPELRAHFRYARELSA